MDNQTVGFFIVLIIFVLLCCAGASTDTSPRTRRKRIWIYAVVVEVGRTHVKVVGADPVSKRRLSCKLEKSSGKHYRVGLRIRIPVDVISTMPSNNYRLR